MTTVWPSAHIIESLATERTFDLIAQVNELLEFEDMLRRRPIHITPRRLFRAILSIQVARAVAATKGASIRLDCAQDVVGAFWQLCPPEDR